MHSENFEKVKRFYTLKVWNETQRRKNGLDYRGRIH